MGSVFLPPVVRSGGPLNRALFTKTLQLAAARVNDVRDIARYRKALAASKELLMADRISAVVDDPTPPTTPDQGVAQGPRKCLLLKCGTSASGMYLGCCGIARSGRAVRLVWYLQVWLTGCSANIMGRRRQGWGAEEGVGHYPLRIKVGI